MNIRFFYNFAPAAIAAAALLTPAGAQTTKQHPGFNMSVSDGKAEHCSDLKVTSKNGEIAQSAEMFTLGSGEASVLELSGADHGVINVRGWDRPEYTVEACKVAVAADRGTAETLLRAVTVSRSAGHFTVTGPTANGASSEDVNWQLFFIVHAPRNGSVDLDTKNGPISVSGINGNVKATAINGPISLSDVAGTVNAKSTNGPISFNGSGGEVHLTAQNGPISLNLSGDVWNGPVLEAHTQNGPLSLNIPDSYRSGVRVESSGHSPMSCKAGACQTAWTDTRSEKHVMQLNGSSDTIRVTTNNGPVAVNAPRARKII